MRNIGLIKLKLSIDNEPIFKSNCNNINDLENVFNDIRYKLRGRK